MRLRDNSIKLLPVCTLDTGGTMFNTLTLSGLRRNFKLSLMAFLMAVSSTATAQDDLVWNTLDRENTVYMQLEEGTVVISLNPTFAPKTVKHFKELLEEKFYMGTSFYRVIDGFVAQFGHMDGDKETDLNLPTLTDEFSRPIQKGTPFIVAQEPAFLSDQTGYLNGFPVGRDFEKGIEFLARQITQLLNQGMTK